MDVQKVMIVMEVLVVHKRTQERIFQQNHPIICQVPLHPKLQPEELQQQQYQIQWEPAKLKLL